MGFCMEATFQIDARPLEEHPAVQAWIKIGGPSPKSVEFLARRNGKPLNHKSFIYRLKSRSANAKPVIAKYARATTMAIERLVYETVLPRLSLPQLHCYGYLEEEDSAFCWLFLEEAGGIPYDEGSSVHRTFASEWLATMHGTTAEMPLHTNLPMLIPARYLAILQSTRSTVADRLGHVSLGPTHVRALKTIITDCDCVEAHWSAFERLWQSIPPCLVHGDFIAKNVRIRMEPTPAVLVMDWEYASWGVPAEDIAGMDPDVYWSSARPAWSDLGIDSIRRLESIGRILQTLSWIGVTAPGIGSDWTETALSALQTYQTRLSRAIASAAC